MVSLRWPSGPLSEPPCTSNMTTAHQCNGFGEHKVRSVICEIGPSWLPVWGHRPISSFMLPHHPRLAVHAVVAMDYHRKLLTAMDYHRKVLTAKGQERGAPTFLLGWPNLVHC